MAHVEPAHLVELALGHATASEEDAGALRHIEQCPRCRDELRTMTRVVTAARTAQLVDLPAAPPERVWQRITHDLYREPPAPLAPMPAADCSRSRRDRLLLTALAALLAAHRARRQRGGTA
ncbi:hypothetical protein [Streptomyces sp. ICBB 8177]|uniref:hypothetical protein n=1 Tax=Streptomyces sp. ICBB 8177 TaxID=563922 RepID=UPI001F546465|nr:hypothetical protein [Streptomyces sp. ICBB 8177]